MSMTMNRYHLTTRSGVLHSLDGCQYVTGNQLEVLSDRDLISEEGAQREKSGATDEDGFLLPSHALPVGDHLVRSRCFRCDPLT